MSEHAMQLLIHYGKIGITALAGLIIIKIILSVLRHLLKKTNLDEVLHKFIINAFKVILLTVLIVIVLDKLGVNTVSIVTVMGVAGAAIALAVRDSLANVAGGITILITKPFNKGDYIEAAGTAGIVQSIDLQLTTMKTYDNKVVTIPNGLVSSQVMTNHSREGMRRVDCVFTIGYNSDISSAREAMLNVASADTDIKEIPQPFVGVAGNGADGIDLDFQVWCDTEKYWDVKYFLEENVKIAFTEADLEMPCHQMDVKIRKK